MKTLRFLVPILVLLLFAVPVEAQLRTVGNCYWHVMVADTLETSRYETERTLVNRLLVLSSQGKQFRSFYGTRVGNTNQVNACEQVANFGSSGDPWPRPIVITRVDTVPGPAPDPVIIIERVPEQPDPSTIVFSGVYGHNITHPGDQVQHCWLMKRADGVSFAMPDEDGNPIPFCESVLAEWSLENDGDPMLFRDLLEAEGFDSDGNPLPVTAMLGVAGVLGTVGFVSLRRRYPKPRWERRRER